MVIAYFPKNKLSIENDSSYNQKLFVKNFNVCTFRNAYLSKNERPYNRNEMRDTYTNLTYVFDKWAQRKKNAQERIFNFLNLHFK